MSLKATGYVWGLTLGDATRKLVLMKYADHAHDDGRNAWCRPRNVAESAECSERTVQRILGWLLGEGYMREGDQSEYIWPKGYSGPKSERFQPIVFDLAMDEETRLEWKRLAAEGANARRDRHVAVGALRRTVGGDSLTPQIGEVNEPQVSGGDKLSPSVRGVTDDLLQEVTTVSPKRTSFKDEPSVSQNLLSQQQAAPTHDTSGTVVDIGARKTTRPDTARGTRLPQGWAPDEGLSAWTRENCPAVRRSEIDRFRDYWIAQPGAKGRKTDWDATWRNWCRKVQDDAAIAAGPTRRTARRQERDDLDQAWTDLAQRFGGVQP